jgi:hypothetical protein
MRVIRTARDEFQFRQDSWMLPESEDHRGRSHAYGQDDDVPEIDVKAQKLLGRALQAHYDDLVSAPIPDRLLMLLVQLEAAEGENGAPSDIGTPDWSKRDE